MAYRRGALAESGRMAIAGGVPPLLMSSCQGRLSFVPLLLPSPTCPNRTSLPRSYHHHLSRKAIPFSPHRPRFVALRCCHDPSPSTTLSSAAHKSSLEEEKTEEEEEEEEEEQQQQPRQNTAKVDDHHPTQPPSTRMPLSIHPHPHPSSSQHLLYDPHPSSSSSSFDWTSLASLVLTGTLVAIAATAAVAARRPAASYIAAAVALAQIILVRATRRTQQLITPGELQNLIIDTSAAHTNAELTLAVDKIQTMLAQHVSSFTDRLALNATTTEESTAAALTRHRDVLDSITRLDNRMTDVKTDFNLKLSQVNATGFADAAERDRAIARAERAEAQCLDLQTRINTLHATTDALRTRSDRLRAEIESAVQRELSAQATLAAANRKLERLELMREDLETADIRIRSLERELCKSKEHLEELAADLGSAKAQVRNQINEKRELLEKLDQATKFPFRTPRSILSGLDRRRNEKESDENKEDEFSEFDSEKLPRILSFLDRRRQRENRADVRTYADYDLTSKIPPPVPPGSNLDRSNEFTHQRSARNAVETAPGLAPDGGFGSHDALEVPAPRTLSASQEISSSKSSTRMEAPSAKLFSFSRGEFGKPTDVVHAGKVKESVAAISTAEAPSDTPEFRYHPESAYSDETALPSSFEVSELGDATSSILNESVDMASTSPSETEIEKEELRPVSSADQVTVLSEMRNSDLPNSHGQSVPSPLHRSGEDQSVVSSSSDTKVENIGIIPEAPKSSGSNNDNSSRETINASHDDADIVDVSAAQAANGNVEPAGDVKGSQSKPPSSEILVPQENIRITTDSGHAVTALSSSVIAGQPGQGNTTNTSEQGSKVTSDAPSKSRRHTSEQDRSDGNDVVATLVKDAKNLVLRARRSSMAVVESDVLFVEATNKLKAALDASEMSADVLAEYGSALLAWARSDLNGAFALERLQDSSRYLALSLEKCPDNQVSLFNRGLCICLIAAAHASENGCELFAEACAMYDRFLDINASSRVGLLNCGLAYISRARLSSVSAAGVSESADYYSRAQARFGQYLSLYPSDDKAKSYLVECERALSSLKLSTTT